MVERVAQGLVVFLQRKDPETDPWETANEDMRSAMREMARHILGTMREPTEEMVERTVMQGESPMITAAGSRARIPHYWRLMIDEALK